MGTALYYISRYQNTHPRWHTSMPVWKPEWSYSNSHNLVNIKALWKKLTESEKFNKILEWHQQ